jgi:hypothetical protein
MPDRIPVHSALIGFEILGGGGRISELRALRKAIEKLNSPWYVRLAAFFRVKRANSELAKIFAAQKEHEKERREHMQHLAENAGKLNYGRFRSRYS